MKKKNLLKIMCSVLLVGVLAFSSLFGCSTPKEEGSLEIEQIKSNGITLQSGFSTVVTEGENKYLEQTVTGFAEPSTAYNYGLEWAIKWEDADETEDVNDYVTITIETFEPDDINYTYRDLCTIRCYKAFPDKNIVLTVTTKEGGYSASALIKYEGLATQIHITTDEDILYESTDFSQSAYSLSTGYSYTFDIELEQIFNVINYTPEYSVSLNITGAINLSNTSDENGELVEAELVEKEPGIFSVKDDAYDPEKDSVYNLFKYSFEGNSITLEILDKPERIGMAPGNGMGTHLTFHSYKDDKPVMFNLSVREGKSGQNATLRFRIFQGVTGVMLGMDTITF